MTKLEENLLIFDFKSHQQTEDPYVLPLEAEKTFWQMVESYLLMLQP